MFEFNTAHFGLNPTVTYISPWYYGGGDVLVNKRFILHTHITISRIGPRDFEYNIQLSNRENKDNNNDNTIKLNIIVNTDLYDEIIIGIKGNNNNNGVTLDIIPDPGVGNGSTGNYNIIIKLEDVTNMYKCLYKKGDTYKYLLHNRNRREMQAFFTRNKRADENDGCPSSQFLLKKNNIFDTIKVPSIFIDFQTLIDGSDIGNTILEVTDQFEYYNHKTTPIIPNYKCQVIQINDPKITRFGKPCPKIVSVLKGIGETADEKISYLHKNNIIDFYNFYINLVKYSMTKYLLSRIMYGQFNIKYVLNKYNNKFLKDLRNTRFCNFVNEFTNPNSDIFGYEQYFL